MSRAHAVLWLALAALVACEQDEMAPGAEDSGTVDDGGPNDPPGCPPPMARMGETPVPAEIADILERRCWLCHGDPVEMFAPMSIVTWEHVQAPRDESGEETVYEAIARRIHSERFPMPPITFEQLTPEERDAFDAWFADCAPPGP